MHTQTLAAKLTATDAPPPVWFMRQAGRYLPEYRSVRDKAGDFLNLCYTPEWACEVTLQPIRRFNCDAAIIFSDILVLLQALGQKLWFEPGEGPRLGAPDWSEMNLSQLGPVYEAIRQTRQLLSKDRNLIGFAGAPWTLLLYALQGKGGADFVEGRAMVYADLPAARDRVDILTDAVATHLENQILAGCDTVQLFDSWAGLCPAALHNDFILVPAQKIVSRLRSRFPGATIIAFPKGFGDLDRFAHTVKPDILGIDQFTRLDPERFPGIALQGNLDPLVLKAGGTALDAAIHDILQTMKGYPFIFNLGHGIDKDTPIDHVERMIKMVRQS